jgi:hypothetical protein
MMSEEFPQVRCYPCRRVPSNYSELFLFTAGNTGSTPVRDAKAMKDPAEEAGLGNVQSSLLNAECISRVFQVKPSSP